MPWKGAQHPYAAWRKVKHDCKRPPIFESDLEGAPPEFVALLKECWAQDPSDRPDMSDVKTRLAQILAANTEAHPTLFSYPHDAV